MEVRAIARQQIISPMKAREVAREIQGLPVSKALDILNFTPKKAALLLGKTLKSAIANATHNHEADANALVVKSATVTEGQTLHRITPRARGSASPIRRRRSHITIVVSDEIEIVTRGPKTAKGARNAKAAASAE